MEMKISEFRESDKSLMHKLEPIEVNWSRFGENIWENSNEILIYIDMKYMILAFYVC